MLGMICYALDAFAVKLKHVVLFQNIWDVDVLKDRVLTHFESYFRMFPSGC